MCRGKTHKGKKLLVFKTTGPGKTVASLKNLPCGEAGCWVCGRFIGEFYGCFELLPDMACMENVFADE